MHPHHNKSETKVIESSFKAYIIGFVLSIILTLVAFYPVFVHINSGHTVYSHEFITIVVLCLAFIQLCVQLFFFLHLGRESKPRYNLIFFVSTASIILLVVIGSIWIMTHLNNNMMPKDVNGYIMQEEGIHP